MLGMLQLLRSTRRSKATDPRDRLFALYNLANDIAGGDGPVLKADYSKSVEKVYRSFVETMIRQSGNLHVLAHAGLHSRSSIEGLPSWVPDWSIDPGYVTLDNGVGSAGYTASSGGVGLVAISPDDAKLQLLAKSLGRVRSSTVLSEGWFTPIPEFRQPGALKALWTDVLRPLGDQYVIGGSTADAFWRTLVGNQDQRGFPATDEYYIHFLSYWRTSRLGDLEAEALGRTATSPTLTQETFDPDTYAAALKRSEEADFSTCEEREAHKRYFVKRLTENGFPCLGRDAGDEAHDESCGSCGISNLPDFFTRICPLPPLRQDDPCLEMMDDPFIADWFHRLRTDEQEPLPVVAATGNAYSGTLTRTVRGRSFIVTEEGLVGLGPSNTEVGDFIVIIAGANTPFIVRPSQAGEGTAGSFSLVGEAYVHGVMGGEALLVGGEDPSEIVWEEIGLQ